MNVFVHGFDWAIYSQSVMPAFARWLVDNDESAIAALYAQTRSAQGERFVPPSIQHLCTWPRAQAFVHQLPRGPYACREYQKLCAAELFTALSDTYMRQFPPRLYQNSEALRTVWGSIVEQFCLPWAHLPAPLEPSQPFNPPPTNPGMSREELVTLLESSGLLDLAHEIRTQTAPLPFGATPQPALEHITEPLISETSRTLSEEEIDELAADLEGETDTLLQGIFLGRHPTTLHLRGWLANISVRAMALFELLACGRRCMPFGYQAGEPFEAFIGYLIPEEVWQLSLCLEGTPPPDPLLAKREHERFTAERFAQSGAFRMVDELPPTHAAGLFQAVQQALQQGFGLICTVRVPQSGRDTL